MVKYAGFCSKWARSVLENYAQHSFIETVKTSKSIPVSILTRIRTKYITDLYSFTAV
jgi:hypothetical protein